MNSVTNQKPKFNSRNLMYMLVGTFLIALGINLFFIPHNIIAGGMNGVSILLYRLLDVSPDITLFVSNFPLLLLSWFFLGKKYTFNTIFCSFLLPIFVKVAAMLPAYHGDVLLAAVFGGVISGLGIGLVFKGGSSTGGTAILQLIAHKYLKLPLGTAVMLIDGIVLLSSFIFFDVTTGLYSVISLVIISKVVDYVQTGGRSAKTMLIVSQNSNQVVTELTTTHDVGVTKIDSRGGYSDEKNTLLICTCRDEQIVAVKEAIHAIDEAAFCVILDAKEVLGYRW